MNEVAIVGTGQTKFSIILPIENNLKINEAVKWKKFGYLMTINL